MTKRHKQRQRQQRSTWAMSKNEHELFELFFKSITMRMNPPVMDEYTDMRRYWQERFSNAFHGQKESLRNESYAELPIMWLAAWRMQQQEIDTKDKQLIEQGQRFNTQSQQIASLKKQLERLGYTDNGGELMKPPIGEPPTFLQYLDQLKKGDRVYVDLTAESATEFSGGQFSGYGVLDRIEDGRVYGRRDDGIPFTCMVSDVTKIEPNPNKSGVRVITPSGESYVRAWDLASKDGEG